MVSLFDYITVPIKADEKIRQIAQKSQMIYFCTLDFFQGKGKTTVLIFTQKYHGWRFFLIPSLAT